MKKIVIVLFLIVLSMSTFVGCLGKESYTETESKYIDIAIIKIEKEYNIDIKKEDFSYMVGKEVSEDNYEAIKDGETPEVVSVSGLAKEPNKQDQYSFGVTFNTVTNENIFISLEKGE